MGGEATHWPRSSPYSRPSNTSQWAALQGQTLKHWRGGRTPPCRDLLGLVDALRLGAAYLLTINRSNCWYTGHSLRAVAAETPQKPTRPHKRKTRARLSLTLIEVWFLFWSLLWRCPPGAQTTAKRTETRLTGDGDCAGRWPAWRLARAGPTGRAAPRLHFGSAEASCSSSARLLEVAQSLPQGCFFSFSRGSCCWIGTEGNFQVCEVQPPGLCGSCRPLARCEEHTRLWAPLLHRGSQLVGVGALARACSRRRALCTALYSGCGLCHLLGELLKAPRLMYAASVVLLQGVEPQTLLGRELLERQRPSGRYLFFAHLLGLLSLSAGLPTSCTHPLLHHLLPESRWAGPLRRGFQSEALSVKLQAGIIFLGQLGETQPEPLKAGLFR